MTNTKYYFLTYFSRYSHEIDWMDVYWQMALGCTNKLMLGLHVRGTYDRVQQLPIKEVAPLTLGMIDPL